jgi:two-component system, NarL family, nitrate/nitrite response regulator NarL
VGERGVILVVDHDRATRSTSARAAERLGYEVHFVDDAELLLDRLDLERPAMAIVAVELPGPLSGLEVLRELAARFGDALPVILVASDRIEPLDRVAGLLLGADDYLAKPVDGGELLARMRRSLRRNGTSSADPQHRPASDPNLSPRELEILALLAEGKTQQQIAETLVISPKTVATHIQHLLSKLGVHSRAQAVAIAFRLGLVEGEVNGHALQKVPALAK